MMRKKKYQHEETDENNSLHQPAIPVRRLSHQPANIPVRRLSSLKKRPSITSLDDEEKPAKRISKTYTTKLLEMLDKKSIGRILQYAGIAKTLATLSKVSRGYRQSVHAALSSCVQDGAIAIPWYTIANELYNYGHEEFDINGDVVKNLELLGFYETVRNAGLLQKTSLLDFNLLIPKSVYRILKFMELVESFPSVKQEWDKQHGCDGQQHLASRMVAYMIRNNILPAPFLIDYVEHYNIHNSMARKYWEHPIYDEYRINVPADLFENNENPVYIEIFFRNLPLHLRLLVAIGNKGMKW